MLPSKAAWRPILATASMWRPVVARATTTSSLRLKVALHLTARAASTDEALTAAGATDVSHRPWRMTSRRSERIEAEKGCARCKLASPCWSSD